MMLQPSNLEGGDAVDREGQHLHILQVLQYGHIVQVLAPQVQVLDLRSCDVAENTAGADVPCFGSLTRLQATMGPLAMPMMLKECSSSVPLAVRPCLSCIG